MPMDAIQTRKSYGIGIEFAYCFCVQQLNSKMSRRSQGRPPKLPQYGQILHSVSVKITTWSKDSHGLFDYHAIPEHLHEENIYLEHECRIFRNPGKNQTVVQNKSESGRPSHSGIQIGTLSIDRNNGTPTYKIKTAPRAKVQSESVHSSSESWTFSPFAVVNNFANKNGVIGYPLQPGNVIKLGRIEFMVIELKNSDQTLTLRDTNHFEQTNGTFEAKKNELTPGSSCKVCLCDEETQENPLIAPCNCKGSCQVIHVGCLRTWINSKVKKELRGIATTYNFTKFQCEICKFPFPKSVRVNETDVEMMKIEKPKKPYLMLESLSKSQSKEEKCLHLISADDSAVKIGRGQGCEIRVADISVSRNHAEICFQSNSFYIKDLDSKFGSLVKFSEEFEIEQEKTIRIQLGRTLLEFQLQLESVEGDTE